MTPLTKNVRSRKFSEIWSKHFCESVEDGGTSYNGFVSTLHRCVPLSKEAYTKAQSRIKCLSFEMSLTCGQWPRGCQSDFKSKLEYLQVTRNFPRLCISHDCRFYPITILLSQLDLVFTCLLLSFQALLIEDRNFHRSKAGY